MTSTRALLLLLLAGAPSVGAAQSMQTILSGNTGFGPNFTVASRSSGGKTENGTRLGGSIDIRRPGATVGSISGYEFGLGFGQINNKVATKSDARENSIELSALAHLLVFKQEKWSVHAGGGAVYSRSLGCTTSGTDSTAGSIPAGEIPCINSFAKSGNNRFGVRARVTGVWGGEWTSFVFGLELSKNTIAAGDVVLPAFFAGVRYYLKLD